MAAAALQGCKKPDSRTAGGAGSMAQQRVRQSNALFDSVAAQLRDLPSSVSLDLRPPTVVLDSRTSRDGQDVMAIATAGPNSPSGLVNYLRVTSDNGRFRAADVEPGDIAKFYVLPDRETMQRYRDALGGLAEKTQLTEEEQLLYEQMAANVQTGTTTFDPIDLSVAQVLDEDTLILATPLIAPVTTPARLEIWRTLDERMKEIDESLLKYYRRGTPMLGWEPSGDEKALAQIVERLNQWLRQSGDAEGWRPASLLETLPESLRTQEELADLVTPAAISRGSFAPHEGRLIQESIWARDVSNWARGGSFDPLTHAQELFDWSVRNIYLTAPDAAPPRRPWQLMLFGRGSAADRAWVFAELCRQQRLPVVVLSFPEATAEDGAPWILCGVWRDEQLWLYDPQLGLPIPGPDGAPVATLTQLRDAPSLLEQLTMDDRTYPLTADDLRTATANVVAEPFTLSERARRVEQKLSGASSVILSVDADAIAQQLRASGLVDQIQLWDYPVTTLQRRLELDASGRQSEAIAFRPYAWRPSLWKARTLHFKGKRENEHQPGRDVLEDPINDHREAANLYLSPRVRPSNSALVALDAEEKVAVYRSAKTDATYWLAMLKFEEGQLLDSRSEYRQSLQWLENDVFDAATAESWSEAVRYNRARALEALGEFEAAAKLYEACMSPQRLGELIRARRIRQLATAEATDEAASEPPETPAESETEQPQQPADE